MELGATLGGEAEPPPGLGLARKRRKMRGKGTTSAWCSEVGAWAALCWPAAGSGCRVLCFQLSCFPYSTSNWLTLSVSRLALALNQGKINKEI